MNSKYKECGACTLPYIEGINGRDGFCDFCGGTGPAVDAAEPASVPNSELFCLATAEPKPLICDRP